jgi:hypothetical protein
MIKLSKNLKSNRSRNRGIALIVAVSASHSFGAFAETMACTLPMVRGPFANWAQENPKYVISAGKGWTTTPDSYYRVGADGSEYTISRQTGVFSKVEHHGAGTLVHTGTCEPVGNGKP